MRPRLRASRAPGKMLEVPIVLGSDVELHQLVQADKAAYIDDDAAVPAVEACRRERGGARVAVWRQAGGSRAQRPRSYRYG